MSPTDDARLSPILSRISPMLAGAIAALALVACSKSESLVAPDGGGEAGTSAGTTCQQIRLCVLQGPCADAACIQTCAQRGTPKAQADFEALRACTATACPTIGDVNCACTEQCQANGACLHEADVCLGTATIDDICDNFCA